MLQVSGNTDLFIHRANLQVNVDAQLIVHLKRDVGRRVGPETDRGRCDLVRACRQGEEVVCAISGGGRYLVKIGLYVPDLHLSTSYDGLCTIMDHARDRTSHISTRLDRSKGEY